MPNAAAMIYESIWRDGDWRKLSRSAQCLYVQLLSQKELDCAGLLPLQPTKWAKGCDEMTVEQLWADLDELQDHRFAFYDVDTDEVLIRTQVHKPFIIKGPKTRESALRAAKLCASPALRAVLSAELRATGLPDFVAAAEDLDPSQPPETNPTDRVSKPYPNPIETLSGGYPIDTPSIPPGTGTGTGLTHLGNNSRGEERPHCAKHPEGNPNDDPCRGCQRARTWDETHAGTQQAAQAQTEAANRRATAQAKAAAIHDCPHCDQDGYRLPQCRTVCDHTDRTETNRNGITKARAALNGHTKTQTPHA